MQQRVDSKPLSLKARFFVYLGLLILAVMVSLAVMAQVYDAELSANNTTRVMDTLDQIAEGVEVELKRIRLLAAAISVDDSLELVQQVHGAVDPGLILQTNREIYQRLDSIFSVMSHEMSLLVFFFDDGTYETFKNGIDEKTARTIRENLRLYTDLATVGGSRIIDNLEPYLTTTGSYLYQLAVAIRPDQQRFPRVSLVYLAMTPDFFNRIINRLKVPQEGPDRSFYAIVSSDGRILYPTAELRKNVDKTAVNQAIRVQPGPRGMQVVEGERRFYLATALELERVPWKIVYFTDRERLTEGSRRANSIVFVLLIPVLGAFTLFFASMHRAILRPLDALGMRMADYATGTEPGPFASTVPEEFTRVFEQFDFMVSEKNRLHHEKIEAERAALQFQINPHFLANTLSAMRFMAMMSRSDGMKGMIEALMDMMSYQLSSPANTSTLARELQNIRRYEYIMKVRYGDTFDITVSIGDDLTSLPILTMLLQPVIENCIEHGIRGIEGRGLVTISARIQNHDAGAFEIVVEDNGRGIAPERLATILLPESSTSQRYDSSGAKISRGRIGVHNVHKRIRNQYGPAFGLHIESELGVYTRVVFRLPLQKSADI